MQTAQKDPFFLPTGHWLAFERTRLFLGRVDVANAVGRHPNSISALERNDRVIPPGWYDALVKLGMPRPVPRWPAEMRPYFGADLAQAMKTRGGLKRSKFWWSDQLGVTEKELLEVLRGNLLVPQNWLLKLGELGVDVPEEVMQTLTRPRPSSPSALTEQSASNLDLHSSIPRAPRAFATQQASAFFGGNEPPFSHPAFAQAPRSFHSMHDLSSHLKERISSGIYEDSEKAPNRTPATAECLEKEPSRPRATSQAPEAPEQSKSDPSPSAQPKRSSVYFHWTEDEGLHFSVSAPLLEQIPAAFRELLVFLHESGLLSSALSKSNQAHGNGCGAQA